MTDKNQPKQTQPREGSVSIPESEIQEGIDHATPGTENHDTPKDDVVSANTPQEGPDPDNR